MLRIENKAMAWYTFNRTVPELRHAVFTRLGGVSSEPFESLNFGGTVGDSPKNVAENHRRALAAFGISGKDVVSPHQVHGSVVANVNESAKGTLIRGTDALITNTTGLGLLLRFADCTPVLIYDAEHHAVGLAHAGWRGVAAKVIHETVKAMVENFASRPENLWAGIGPAIGPQHYAVGPEVVEAIQATLAPQSAVAKQREGKWYMDMPKAITLQLQSLGITDIEPSELCTASNTDEWFSHRAEQGKTGRFGVLVMLD